MAEIERTGGSGRRIQSIEVGFRLIRVLERANGPLPLKQVAAQAGMPPSKAHLYMVSFTREGMVRQDPETGHYALGPFAMQIGMSTVRQTDITALARPELLDLADHTGFAAYVSLWGSRGPVIVVRVDGTHQGSLSVRVGFVLPLLRTATGQVFLVHLPKRETATLKEAEILAETEGAETVEVERRRAEIEDALARTRQEGIAVTGLTRSHINAGFMAFSAPIFDHSGGLHAAMTLLGPREMMDEARRRDGAAALKASAARLSAKLGYRP